MIGWIAIKVDAVIHSSLNLENSKTRKINFKKHQELEASKKRSSSDVIDLTDEDVDLTPPVEKKQRKSHDMVVIKNFSSEDEVYTLANPTERETTILSLLTKASGQVECKCEYGTLNFQALWDFLEALALITPSCYETDEKFQNALEKLIIPVSDNNAP